MNRCQGWCPNSRVLVQRPWGHLLLNGRHVCMDIVEEQARQGAEHAGGGGGVCTVPLMADLLGQLLRVCHAQDPLLRQSKQAC